VHLLRLSKAPSRSGNVCGLVECAHSHSPPVGLIAREGSPSRPHHRMRAFLLGGDPLTVCSPPIQWTATRRWSWPM
jgi:hypothetical protein